MKKLLLLLLLAATALSLPPKATAQKTGCLTNFTRQQCVVETYKSQIGVKEATGNNDGVQVEKYLKTVNLSKGYAWCAAFVKWCLLQCNVADAKNINAMAASTHSTSRLVYFKGKFIRQPQPSDVGTIYYSSLKRIGHTFFLTDTQATEAYTPLKEIPTAKTAGRETACTSASEASPPYTA